MLVIAFSRAPARAALASARFEGANTAVQPSVANPHTFANAVAAGGDYVLALTSRRSNGSGGHLEPSGVTLSGRAMRKIGQTVARGDDYILWYFGTADGAGHLVIDHGMTGVVLNSCGLWAVSGITTTGLVQGIDNVDAAGGVQSVTLPSVPNGALVLATAYRRGGGNTNISFSSGIESTDHRSDIGATSEGAGGHGIKIGSGDHVVSADYGGIDGDKSLLSAIALPAV